MTESARIGLTGSLREAVVIVASILVAFGLDAGGRTEVTYEPSESYS